MLTDFCPAPAAVDFEGGSLQPTSSFPPNGNDRSLGAKAAVNCDAGYELNNAGGECTCAENGQWDCGSLECVGKSSQKGVPRSLDPSAATVVNRLGLRAVGGQVWETAAPWSGRESCLGARSYVRVWSCSAGDLQPAELRWLRPFNGKRR